MKSDFESSLIQIILLLCYAVNFQHFICRHHWLKFPKPWDRDFLFANCSRKNCLLAQWVWASEACIWPELQCPLEMWRYLPQGGAVVFTFVLCICVCLCVCVCSSLLWKSALLGVSEGHDHLWQESKWWHFLYCVKLRILPTLFVWYLKPFLSPFPSPN